MDTLHTERGQRAHRNIWHAWVQTSAWTLDECQAVDAIKAAGYEDVNDAWDILQQLVICGDVKEHHNRDLITYSVLKDEFGFAATK